MATIDQKWLRQQISVVYSYWSTRVSSSELYDKCVERTLYMIQQYRDGIDAETYRKEVEDLVKARIERGDA